jgi:hypothetical protein
MIRKIATAILPNRWLYLLRLWIHLKKVKRLQANTATEPFLAQRRLFYNHEWQVFSQFGEDGLLLYIFSKIGTTDRRFVEFGIEDGRQCNTANLSINCGWSGLLMEGNPDDAAKAGDYYASRAEIKPGQVTVLQHFITAENIDELISSNGIIGEIDLLSVDIDGNDYWVWKAITCIQPRVLVVEFQGTLGTEKSLTIPYDPKFARGKDEPFYYGASLRALTKLAKEKGYALVGTVSSGINAFFVRKDLCCDGLMEVTVEEAYNPSFWMRVKDTRSKRLADYQEV